MADKFGLKKVRDRKYLNKDFNSLKSDLVGYARQYYKDTIVDFSESSLSGMLVELAAYVGDTMSFYLDHQFSELNPDTAVETTNIENHIKNSGIEIVGSSPAVVNQSFYIEVPAKTVNGEYVPDDSYFPVITADLFFPKTDNTVSANSRIETSCPPLSKFAFFPKILLGYIPLLTLVGAETRKQAETIFVLIKIGKY